MTDDLAARRIETVKRHMALEITHEWDAVIATFDGHPRYEMYGTGQVFDGEAAVRAYFAASRTPFPDQGNEIISIAHGGETVLVEFWLTGTHSGPLQDRRQDDPADGPAVPRAHGRDVRIHARLGQDPLRAPLLRPDGRAQGAADRLRRYSLSSA